MANYYATATWSATEADYVSRIETALLACGWTVYDNINSTHQVMRSPGTNGATNVFTILEIYGNGGGSVAVNACFDWDPSAHVGILKSAGGGFITVGGTGYIYANALGAFICVIDGTYDKMAFVGQPRANVVPNVNDGICATTAGITAGDTGVAVDTDLTGHLYVGQVVAIQNFAHNNSSSNKTNRELVTITAIAAGTLSFTATANAYDSGARIASPDLLYPMGAVPGQYNTFSGNYLPCSLQAIGLDQAYASITNSIGPGFQLDGGANADLLAWNVSGLPPVATLPILVQDQASNNSTISPVYGFILVFQKIAAGVPGIGTKYTDGVNVFVQPKAVPASGNPVLLIGPTGDAPNFGTMTRILPTMVPVSDSIYAVPPVTPPTSAPTNGTNQGIN